MGRRREHAAKGYGGISGNGLYRCEQVHRQNAGVILFRAFFAGEDNQSRLCSFPNSAFSEGRRALWVTKKWPYLLVSLAAKAFYLIGYLPSLFLQYHSEEEQPAHTSTSRHEIAFRQVKVSSETERKDLFFTIPILSGHIHTQNYRSSRLNSARSYVLMVSRRLTKERIITDMV
jgi:hypothetical protein